MKKYFYLLMVAFFATMSFALTSCGDDDDEPNDGNGKGIVSCDITVNGTKLNARVISADYNNGELSIMVNNSFSGAEDMLIFDATVSPLLAGKDVTDVCDVTPSILTIEEGCALYKTDDNESGSVFIESYDSSKNTVTVKFSNYTYYSMYCNGSVAVNGKVKAVINDGTWYSVVTGKEVNF